MVDIGVVGVCFVFLLVVGLEGWLCFFGRCEGGDIWVRVLGEVGLWIRVITFAMVVLSGVGVVNFRCYGR